MGGGGSNARIVLGTVLLIADLMPLRVQICAAVCQVHSQGSFCGSYATPCSGWSTNITSATNIMETMTFDGAVSGKFTRTFKSYAIKSTERCSGIVLESWTLTGSFVIGDPSTCGGTCDVCGHTWSFLFSFIFLFLSLPPSLSLSLVLCIFSASIHPSISVSITLSLCSHATHGHRMQIRRL